VSCSELGEIGVRVAFLSRNSSAKDVGGGYQKAKTRVKTEMRRSREIGGGEQKKTARRIREGALGFNSFQARPWGSRTQWYSMAGDLLA
jgi:hypothetical protein